jgi:hypothetical protein
MMAEQDLRDLTDPQEEPDHKEQQDLRGLQEQPVVMVLMERKVQQVQRDLPDLQEIRDLRVLVVQQDYRVHLGEPHSNTISAQLQLRLTQQQENLDLIILLKMPPQVSILMIATSMELIFNPSYAL